MYLKEARKLKGAQINTFVGCAKIWGAKTRGSENKRGAKIKGIKVVRYVNLLENHNIEGDE